MEYVAQIIVDSDGEALRIEKGKFALGEEVIYELFGKDATISQQARDVVVQLGDITQRLGLGLISYEKGA